MADQMESGLIEDLEEKLRQAMLNSDITVLDDLIADDLVWTMHTGVVSNKEQDLEAHRSGIFRFTKLDISDRQIHPFSCDCVVVTLKAEIGGILNSQAFSEDYRFTRVWLQRNNRWQIAAGHVSQLPFIP
ncbi:nuclear transport factor 2 family protein [Phormidium sp. FACHB-77]|uniref:nuclear transport factor 2 family protein n=1 Tax=Cyanophyceae TaxID=3028117 RepID=UPI0016830E5D|nr:nuclear transport factor 2 family protein [Phormidium sp. FACHB-77]MBD1919339.1 nuclear transport factor 2 family protein [Phormidium sp. FACHB-77]